MNYLLCADGKQRSESEYNEWLDSLMELYQTEEGDLTPEEREALVDAGYIVDEDFIRVENQIDKLFEDIKDFYVMDADEVYEKVQYELSDEERKELYKLHNGEELTDMNDFWDWWESLDDYEIEDIGNDLILSGK